MNHTSMWMKFFDERTGHYRYKHKGSGVVRDMLMAIGKSFAKTATQSVKKAVEKDAKQAAEKGKRRFNNCGADAGSATSSFSLPRRSIG